MNLGHVDFKARIDPYLRGIVTPLAKGIVSRKLCNNYGIAWLVISIKTEFEGQQEYKESFGRWSLLL